MKPLTRSQAGSLKPNTGVYLEIKTDKTPQFCFAIVKSIDDYSILFQTIFGPIRFHPIGYGRVWRLRLLPPEHNELQEGWR